MQNGRETKDKLTLEALQAFAEAHTNRAFHKLQLRHIKTVCEFINQHLADLTPMATPQVIPPFVEVENDISPFAYEPIFDRRWDFVAYGDSYGHTRDEYLSEKKTLCGKPINLRSVWSAKYGESHQCPECKALLDEPLPKSQLKELNEWFQQSEGVKISTTPLNSRCVQCGLPASRMRVGYHYCSECLIEADDDYED